MPEVKIKRIFKKSKYLTYAEREDGQKVIILSKEKAVYDKNIKQPISRKLGQIGAQEQELRKVG